MALAYSTWPRNVSVQRTEIAEILDWIQRPREDDDLEGDILLLQPNGEMRWCFGRVLERTSSKIPKVKRHAILSLREFSKEKLGRDPKTGLPNLLDFVEIGPRKVPAEDARNLWDQQKAAWQGDKPYPAYIDFGSSYSGSSYSIPTPPYTEFTEPSATLQQPRRGKNCRNQPAPFRMEPRSSSISDSESWCRDKGIGAGDFCGETGSRNSAQSTTGSSAVPITQRAIYEPSLSARLKGNDVVAFPDTGAAANFISLQYVRARGLAINLDARRRVKTATGSLISILGTVTLPFSFEGERKSHRLEFNVLRNAVHDIVLGSPFLKLTETMTRHVHRIKQKLREACSPRLCFLGSQQYVGGWANGTYVDAMPDTGAHVSVMSASFARENGFVVNTAEMHRKDLEFADSSIATTMGVVEGVEWNFESSRDSHRLDVYVLEGLQTDLILDNTFLLDTDAFVVHEDDFSVDDDESADDYWSISIIMLVDKALKGSRLGKPASPPESAAPDDPESLWQLEKSNRLDAYRLARKQAQSMPEHQRRSFLEPHLAQWELFLQSRPNNASMSQSSLSQVASSTSSVSAAAGVPVSNVTTTLATSRKTRFFSKLRGIKGKTSSPTGTSPVAP